jgi:hypothetical protein
VHVCVPPLPERAIADALASSTQSVRIPSHPANRFLEAKLRAHRLLGDCFHRLQIYDEAVVHHTLQLECAQDNNVNHRVRECTGYCDLGNALSKVPCAVIVLCLCLAVI